MLTRGVVQVSLISILACQKGKKTTQGTMLAKFVACA